MARLSGNATMLAWNLFGRSATATAAGDTDLACTTAEESMAVLRGPRPVLVSVWASLTLATAVSAEAGDPNRAARLLTDTMAGRACRSYHHRYNQPVPRCSPGAGSPPGRRSDAAEAQKTSAATWAAR